MPVSVEKAPQVQAAHDTTPCPTLFFDLDDAECSLHVSNNISQGRGTCVCILLLDTQVIDVDIALILNSTPFLTNGVLFTIKTIMHQSSQCVNLI